MKTVGCELNLADIMAITPEPVDLAWDHAMDISAAVYTRLKELGMTQKELADAMGVSAGRVSQIINGEAGMSLKTLARIECALDFRLDAGFRYTSKKASGHKSSSADILPQREKTGWSNPLKVRNLSVMIGGMAA